MRRAWPHKPHPYPESLSVAGMVGKLWIGLGKDGKDRAQVVRVFRQPVDGLGLAHKEVGEALNLSSGERL